MNSQYFHWNKKLKIRQWLVEPIATIPTAYERRQASLVSTILLILVLSNLSGVFFLGFVVSEVARAFILAGAFIAVGVVYILSRTRQYRLAAPLALIVMSIIPVLNDTAGLSYSFITLG